jgi:hypothetical protein
VCGFGGIILNKKHINKYIKEEEQQQQESQTKYVQLSIL